VTGFSLLTHWHLDASIDRVWEALVASPEWPRWWRYVHAVEEIEPGDRDGLGVLRRYTWSSRLPYRLSFLMRVSAVRRPTFLEGKAEGDLSGVGSWYLATEQSTTRVRYEWRVATTKRWMNRLAPLLTPIFRWNHDQVMAEGGRGLARHLGVRLLSLRSPEER
jgi:uncharacterized protein YndB with AHSA1/START domain